MSIQNKINSFLVKRAINRINLSVKKDMTLGQAKAESFYNLFGNWFNNKYPNHTKYRGWVASCVDVWGKNFAQVKFRLYERLRDGNVAEVYEHPILDIFRKPNDFQTRWEQKYREAQHYALFGNAYYLKIYDGLGVPRQLIQLDPTRIKAVSSRTDYISYYEYHLGYEVIKLEPSAVIHYKYPDPINLIKGRSVISGLDIELDIDSYQREYLRKFYEQGGFMGLTFTTKETMEKDAWDRVNSMLQEKYGAGMNNQFKVALLESGLMPVKSAYSLKDLDLKPQRELSRDEIISAFQVSKVWFGEGTSLNRANADTMVYQLAIGVIEPIMSYHDEVLTNELCVKDFGKEFFIKHDAVASRDIELLLKYYESGIQNGWLNPNEVREEENYEEYEGGEVFKSIQGNTKTEEKDSEDIEKEIKKLLNNININ